jgi:hypothetical protein
MQMFLDEFYLEMGYFHSPMERPHLISMMAEMNLSKF